MKKTGQWYLHLFSEKQPDLNWENPKLREAVYAMMNRWFDRGVDGFRMDVISLIAKAPGLPDGQGDGYVFAPEQFAFQPKLHEYLREMRRRCFDGRDCMCVGETTFVTPENANSVVGDGRELDLLFQFDCMDLDGRDGKWNVIPVDLKKFKQLLVRWQEAIDWNTLFWGNHDQPRAVSRFGSDAARPECEDAGGGHVSAARNTVFASGRGDRHDKLPVPGRDAASRCGEPYKDVTGAARETMRRIVDQLETVEDPPESIRQKLMELALELHTVNGKKQYGYLKKPLKDMVDSIVDELENLPEVAAYYSVWNDLRDTLEGYYKSKPRQHNPLSQQKEFRAIKNAIIQEAERLRQQMEQESSQGEESPAEETSRDASTNPTLADENTSSPTSPSARLPSEYLLNSTIRLFHQMGQIFRDNAAPSSNPMGIRIDSKRRKKLMQKRLELGHKQDDHEQAQGYEQSL